MMVISQVIWIYYNAIYVSKWRLFKTCQNIVSFYTHHSLTFPSTFNILKTACQTHFKCAWNFWQFDIFKIKTYNSYEESCGSETIQGSFRLNNSRDTNLECLGETQCSWEERRREGDAKECRVINNNSIGNTTSSSCSCKMNCYKNVGIKVTDFCYL